ncbi:hypothetical protein [Actinoplanes sp. CA-252034]|uniref:hypothetical protein n=1 Tax=Actinoplanes sp. CA-252034 TaxID=3239906 RepID=UPI003D957E64
MTRPIVHLDTSSLTDEQFAVVSELLDALGVEGEELSPHLGIPDELGQLLVFSTDSLGVLWDAMLATAGGAAAVKLTELLRRLPRRRNARGEQGRVVSVRDDQVAFVVSDAALADEAAMTAMRHVDTAALQPGTVLVWDPAARRWRGRE